MLPQALPCSATRQVFLQPARLHVGLRYLGGAGPCLSARLQVGFCVTPPVAAAESDRSSLTFPSDNVKTGPIAVSSTSRHTCPSSCPLAVDQGCLLVEPRPGPHYTMAELLAASDYFQLQPAEEREWIDLPSVAGEPL